MSAVPLVLKLTTQRTSHPQNSQVAELVRRNINVQAGGVWHLGS